MSFCLRSWLTGFALGLSGAPYPYSAPVPTAYLYNGIRLPALPEWDRGVYPYAYIAQLDTNYYFLARVTKRNVTSDGRIAASGESQVFKLDDGVWVEDWNTALMTLIWTNTDTYYSDGNLFLSASEPVPVYN